MNPWPSLFAIALASTTTFAGATTYRAQDLGNLGASGVTVTGVNSAGQVVGQSARPGAGIDFPHAFATGRDGIGMVDLCPGFPGNACGATGINGLGQVVGWIDNGLGFVVDSDGTSFQTISGADLVGINDEEHVAGNVVVDASGKTRAAVAYTPFGPFHQISSLTGTGGQSTAMAISGGNKVVGCSVTATGDTHAFRAKSRLRHSMTDLGTLGGADSCATAIDDAGDMAGYADTADGQTHAFFVGHNGGRLQDLGTLGGSTSVAMGIATGTNRHQHVVGYSTFGSNPFAFHAFLFDRQKGRMFDLNTLVDLPGVTLDQAIAINGSDQIAATSSDGRGWLLTPIEHHP